MKSTISGSIFIWIDDSLVSVGYCKQSYQHNPSPSCHIVPKTLSVDFLATQGNHLFRVLFVSFVCITSYVFPFLCFFAFLLCFSGFLLLCVCFLFVGVSDAFEKRFERV